MKAEITNIKIDGNRVYFTMVDSLGYDFKWLYCDGLGLLENLDDIGWVLYDTEIKFDKLEEEYIYKRMKKYFFE